MTGLSVLAAGRVFDGETMHRHAAVLLDGDRIAGLAPRGQLPENAPVLALPDDCVLAPGFVDTQVNGGGGALFNDRPDTSTIRTIVASHRRFGTTGLLPTLITDTVDAMERAVDAVDRMPAGSGVLGIHLEGPFLNPLRKGVHRTTAMRRLDDEAARRVRLARPPAVTLVTLAPEMADPGAIRTLVDRGAIVAAGHSDATERQVKAAIDEGLSGFTHLFNAMSQLGSREPGVVGAALAGAGTFAGIIADGFHVADATLRIAFAARGAGGLMLVTDAMPPVGGNLTSFDLFDRRIVVTDGRCLTEDGTLAGAALDMAAAVRHCVRRLGIPEAAALAMASFTPARFLGLDDRIGRIAPGYRADLVALSAEGRVLQTWVSGRGS